MGEMVETTPSDPYFGELWDMPDPSLGDVRSLAWPSPTDDGCRLYPGWTLPASSDGQLFTPAFLPAEEHETLDCLWMCLTGLPSVALGGAAAAAGAASSIPKSWVGLPRGLGSKLDQKLDQAR